MTMDHAVILNNFDYYGLLTTTPAHNYTMTTPYNMTRL